LTAVAVKYNELQDADAEVLAISTDSHFVHKVWQEEELSKMIEGGLPFPMLADPGGDIGKMYNVYDAENGINIRGKFVIDPDGVLQAMEILNEPTGRNVEELVRQVRALQHTSNTCEATPAGWQPGKKTLTPGEDLVGKVHEEWDPEEELE